jgi:hypothetical protein
MCGAPFKHAGAIPISPRLPGAALSNSPVLDGESPTTGLKWSGSYRPVLVQISNAVAARPHWNLSEADVVYEALYWTGHTSYTALYNDNHPDMVGAVRSARLHHAQLREEWDCPFVFWGGQGGEPIGIYDFFKTRKVESRFLFDGNADNRGDVLTRSSESFERSNPHNMVADIKLLVDEYYPGNYIQEERPFLFTDMPSMGDDAAISIDIMYGTDFHPIYTYNEDLRVYERSYDDQPQIDGYTEERIVASNVIVQRMNIIYYNGIASRPIYEETGEGIADIFIDGRMIQGSWVRNSLEDRTIFLDSTGTEVELLQGKTFIQIIPDSMSYSYARDDGSIVMR